MRMKKYFMSFLLLYINILFYLDHLKISTNLKKQSKLIYLVSFLFLNSCYLILIVYISKLICVRLFWYMHIVTLPLAFHKEKHSILHLYLIWRLVFWRLVFPRWMGIIFNFFKISAVNKFSFFHTFILHQLHVEFLYLSWLIRKGIFYIWIISKTRQASDKKVDKLRLSTVSIDIFIS